jgi:hypothetical protein
MKIASPLGSLAGGLAGAGLGALAGFGADEALDGVDLKGIEDKITGATGLTPPMEHSMHAAHQALNGHGATIGAVLGGIDGARQGSKIAECWATEYFKLAALGLVRPLPANHFAAPGTNINPMAGNALKVRTRPNIKPQLSSESSGSLQAPAITPGVPAKMAAAFAFFVN